MERPTNRAPLHEKYGASCRQMYVNLRLTPAEIAGRLKGKVQASTVSGWAKRYGWDAARAMRTAAPAAMVEDVQTIFKQFVATATEAAREGRLPNEKFWDNLIKGAAAIERLSGEAHFAAHMTKFVDGLLKYAQTMTPELVPQISELLAGYSTTVLSSR